MKFFITSQASKHMAHDKSKFITPQLEKFVIPQVEEEVPKIICRHHEYCRVRTFGRINCLTQLSVQGCQTYKFFEKYGKNYLEMGVGT